KDSGATSLLFMVAYPFTSNEIRAHSEPSAPKKLSFLGLHYAEPSREETSVTGETTGEKRAQRKPQKLPDSRPVHRSIALTVPDFSSASPRITGTDRKGRSTSRARVERKAKILKNLPMDRAGVLPVLKSQKASWSFSQFCKGGALIRRSPSFR